MEALTVVIGIVAVMSMAALYSDLAQDRKISALREEIHSMGRDLFKCKGELFNMLGHSEIDKLRLRVSKLKQGSDYGEQVKSRLIRKGQPDEFKWVEGLRVSNYQTLVKELDKVNDSPEDKIKHLQKKIANDLLELKKEVTKSHEIVKNEELTTSCISNFIREVEAEVKPKSDDTF